MAEGIESTVVDARALHIKKNIYIFIILMTPSLTIGGGATAKHPHGSISVNKRCGSSSKRRVARLKDRRLKGTLKGPLNEKRR